MKKSLLKASSLLVVILAMAGFTAQAQEDTAADNAGESKVKIEEVKETNKVSDDVDPDQLITNKKMRAEAGSKSKWSIGTALNYSGATVEAPLKPVRPNIAGVKGTTDFATLAGTVDVGYKLNAQDRIGVGTGVRWVTPFEKNTPKDYEGDQYDASNPNIGYSKLYKWSGIQSVFSLSGTWFTATDLRKAGYQHWLSLSQNNVYDFGSSGFSIGAVPYVDYFGFDKTSQRFKDDNGNLHRITEKQGDYDFGVSPFMEYVINDTFNLRTVFNWIGYSHSRAQSAFWTLAKDKDTQSVGLGISVTRDIFLYPNIQFAPKDITHIFRADETNVALNTNINIF